MYSVFSVIWAITFVFASPCDGCWPVIGQSVIRYAETLTSLQKEPSPSGRSLKLQEALEATIREIPNSRVLTRSKMENIVSALKENRSENNHTLASTTLANSLADTKETLLHFLRGNQSRFSVDLRSSVEKILQLLASNSSNESAIREAVHDSYESYNRAEQERIDALTRRLGTGRLQPYFSETMKTLDRIAVLIKAVKFNFKANQYEPEFVLAVRSRSENVKEIMDMLADLHRVVVLKQRKYGNKTFVGYLMNEVCQKVANNRLSCSYYVCQNSDIKEILSYLKLAQEVAYEWLKILTTFSCQHKEKIKSAKMQCLMGERESEIDAQKAHRMKIQSRVFNETLKNNQEASQDCVCPIGEFQTLTLNGTVVVCEKCPSDTFNVKRGAGSCTKCPMELEVSHSSFHQCLNSRLQKMKDLKDLEKDLENQKKLLNEMEEEKNRDPTEYIHKDRWIKVQRRAMGSHYNAGKFGNADSRWADFVTGFGSPHSYEFWLGLEKIRNYTMSGTWDLMFVAKWNSKSSSRYPGDWGYSVYENFYVEDEENDFKLHLGNRKENSKGPNQEPFSYFGFANNKFSTSDRNSGPCSTYGAWWHRTDSRNCKFFCFNCANQVFHDGNNWFYADETEMLMRKVD